MTKKLGTDTAYALESLEDHRRLYADWAATYDRDFADATDYQSPRAVADAYAALVGDGGVGGPVLDVGAGTGLVGVALAARGIDPIEGTDLSPDMLAQAEAKGVYARTFVADVTKPFAGGPYAGAVSAGTFTLGHVGPAALAHVLAVVQPGGWVLVTVHTDHWARQGFDAALIGMADLIAETRRAEIPIYGPAATNDHAGDRAVLLSLRRSDGAAQGKARGDPNLSEDPANAPNA